MKTIKLCEEKYCTGCSACSNVCVQNAIEMRDGIRGELHPFIDYNKCIQCGLCEKVCPQLNTPQMISPMRCYAASKLDKNNMKREASGGIATLIISELYKQGYTIFATRLDKDMIPKIVKITSLDEIDFYKGSLYVQSVAGDSFSKIQKSLSDGDSVLFVGTPCQVAGLRAFLKKDWPKLVCCDLFCHGTIPTSYFEEEIRYLKKKAITRVTFRGYDDREDYWLILWNGMDKVYVQSGNVNYYMKSFSDAIALRESCYYCQYSTQKRTGDISLGDFLGLENSIAKNFKINCVNAVLVNTKKGKMVMEYIYDLIECYERPYVEAVGGDKFTLTCGKIFV